jgi:hypothetical protein
VLASSPGIEDSESAKRHLISDEPESGTSCVSLVPGHFPLPHQLFFEVTAENEPNCCSAFLLLHLGHATRFLSCSAMVNVIVKAFLQALHIYS